MAPRRDPSGVGHDEELLRRFVACRDAGDATGAQRWWEELVTAQFDRVAGMVATWRGGGLLRGDERDEAVQRALVKLWANMVRTFEGSSMGEWVNATRACVDFACRDVQRAAAVRSARERSLDVEPPEGAPADRRLDALAREQHRRAAEREEASDFVAWALPRLGDARRRTVIERTLDGVPAEAIAGELGVSLANLYQLRSRALKDLAKLKEQDDA